MCGRASQVRAKKFGEMIARWVYPDDFEPRHNLRPTEPAWIVARREDGAFKTLRANWWCQTDGTQAFETKFPTFNARVDTMYKRRLWSDLLKKGQRCLFPIDSFYEWPVKGRRLPPVEIFLKGREPYALAGLWSRWFDKGDARYSFAVFTTEPNEFMQPLHEKAMPVILGDLETQERWLTEGDEGVLVPYPGKLECDQLPDTLENLFPAE